MSTPLNRKHPCWLSPLCSDMPYRPEYLLRLLQKFTQKPYQTKQIQALAITGGHLHFIPLDISKFKWMSTLLFNALIRSYLITGHPVKALLLFTHMLRHQSPPNNFTLPSLVKAATSFCSSLPSLASSSVGSTLHGQAVRRGLSSDPFVQTSFISFYGKSGGLVDARLVFDEIPDPCIVSCNSMMDAFGENGEMELAMSLFQSMYERDVYTWTSVINGFGCNGRYVEAITFFEMMMVHEDVICGILRPNEATFVSVLASCASLVERGALYQGKQIHGYMIKNEIELTVFMGTALISFYGKLGCLTYASRVFYQTKSKKVCTWNAIMSSLASNGEEKRAIDMFERMKQEKVRPNKVTFVAVLTACSRAKLVQLGIELFQSMSEEFGITPVMEHYGCVVDLLGRAGCLNEADVFIQRMPFEPDESVLGALLGACKVHGDIKLGNEVGRRLISLQPWHCGRYIALSSLSAWAQKWGSAFDLRRTMVDVGTRKNPAYSLIEPLLTYSL